MSRLTLSPRLIRALWIALSLFALALWLRSAWVCDDAFITLRTVDNLLHGYGPRWNVMERVQSFTHPLWMLWLVPLYGLIRDPYYAVLAAGLIGTAGSVWLLVRYVAPTHRGAAAAILLLMVSRGFVDFSSAGLENPLTHLLSASFALAVWRIERRQAPLWLPSLLASLLLLTRLDLACLIGPTLIWLMTRCKSWRAGGQIVIGMTPLIIWSSFSLIYYGSVLPNTALAKLQSGLPAHELSAQGLRYLAVSLHHDPATLLGIMLALFVVGSRGGTGERLLMIGVVLHLAYTVSVGGDFMAGRFLTAPFFLAVVCLARLSDAIEHRLTRWSWLLIVAAGLFAPSSDTLIDRSGIADERRNYFASAGLFNGAPGWTRPSVDARLSGDIARATHASVLIEQSVGVVGFYAGPSVTVIDRAALCDPLLARLPMAQADPLSIDHIRRVAGVEPLHPWRIGHFFRNLPRGYLSSVLTQQNQIADREIASLYRDVTLLTRAPLWSAERWAAIVRRVWAPTASSGVLQPFEPPDWNEVLAVRPDDAEALFRRAARSQDPGPDLQRAVALAPRHALAWMDFGSWRQRSGDTEAALAAWQHAAEVAPGWAPPWISIGVAQAKAGQLAQALASLQRAQSADPRDARSYAPLGLALMQSGQRNAARQILARGAAWGDRASRNLLTSLDRSDATSTGQDKSDR